MPLDRKLFEAMARLVLDAMPELRERYDVERVADLLEQRARYEWSSWRR